MTEIKLKAIRETRSDLAERTIEVDGAALLSYQTRKSYADRTLVLREWRPTYLRLSWSRGVLRSAYVMGSRLKKDGSVGAIKETATFRIMDGVVQPATAYSGGEEKTKYEVPQWLTSAIEQFGTVPDFRDDR